ncbi:MAG: flavin oxidoreductase [Oceanospirillales bacterium]|uniref:Flavin reductase (DIM6/NTAB) family NADH-FMN oxidoreductase RutF n=1 Tax=Marinobacterium halophilum TaxID=267374 RepID=A0A2P8F356_9GAMM|nr:flavin reductase [Marinobacterium halophilum]MBR9828998.1 flavin oxidoreductase [Oceanospirillales bacterium]PSL16149.1 flavin reductase (DIM6/NTAB) family NADH-FMN oxidoreductase RutF [Marinobacterium halophilum]
MSNQVTEFDPKAFRRALGNFATGITVITATTPSGEKTGVTANSFNSVSLEPALILWSIDKRSGSCKIFEEATHFAVNILAADQIDVSNHFARPSDDKFADVDYQEGLGGAALLNDTAACFQCESYETLDGGDHWILIGKVVAFEDAGRAPLVYHQGSYSVVMPHSRFPAKTDDQPAAVEQLEGRLSNNLYYLMTQAVRSYQADYAPLQLSTGLRTSEARMLMVLQQTPSLCRKELLKEVNMPDLEVTEAAEILQRKGLITFADDCYRITEKGIEQAETLWRLSDEEQEKKFSSFSEDELATFKKVLSTLAAQ